MGRHETFSFFAAIVLFTFQYIITFLISYLPQFSEKGVFLGESQVHKILSLLKLQVQLDRGSSVLLSKFALRHI